MTSDTPIRLRLMRTRPALDLLDQARAWLYGCSERYIRPHAECVFDLRDRLIGTIDDWLDFAAWLAQSTDLCAVVDGDHLRITRAVAT